MLHPLQFLIACLITIPAFISAPQSAAAFNLPGLNRPETIKAINNTVIIPFSKIDRKARFFVFKNSGKEIRFFMVKGSNGTIHTAFDACDACYREKKGYEQKEDRMICRNCSMKFPIDRLGPNASGGCNPSYLLHRVEGNSIVINVNDLMAGARFF